jgi:sulfur relay (sulfurtransferase) complex TusBCD TusD component (DsrE family)
MAYSSVLMETLTMILQSPSYRDERIWNALRLAKALITATIGMKINIFLLGDAVSAAKKGRNRLKATTTLKQCSKN